MIAFGPVPSRRLGRSLGINNIPPKVCTYSCVYCQVGRTHTLQVERCPFFEPEEIFKSVSKQVKKAGKKDESIDYLTFVSDGEPTLDANLGDEIDLLKSMGKFQKTQDYFTATKPLAFTNSWPVVLKRKSMNSFANPWASPLVIE